MLSGMEFMIPIMAKDHQSTCEKYPMIWINRYLECTYEDGARGPDKHDCWSFVRSIRYAHLGMRLLPSYGSLRNDDPRSFTKAYLEQSSLMEPCEPEHGAIAAVMHGKVCVHVATVLEYEGRLRILEINPVRGPRFMLLADWLRGHLTVTYHRDKK